MLSLWLKGKPYQLFKIKERLLILVLFLAFFLSFLVFNLSQSLIFYPKVLVLEGNFLIFYPLSFEILILTQDIKDKEEIFKEIPFFDQRIELLVLTSAFKDWFKLKDIILRYKVKKVILVDNLKEKLPKDFKAVLKERDTSFYRFKKEVRIYFAQDFKLKVSKEGQVKLNSFLLNVFEDGIKLVKFNGKLFQIKN